MELDEPPHPNVPTDPPTMDNSASERSSNIEAETVGAAGTGTAPATSARNAPSGAEAKTSTKSSPALAQKSNDEDEQGEEEDPDAPLESNVKLTLSSYRPMPVKSSLGLTARQMKVMLRKNFTLLVRYWPTTLLQVFIAPIVCLLFLYVLQAGQDAIDSTSNAHPIPYDLYPTLPCQGATRNSPCYTVMYTPSTPQTDLFMSTFVTNNNLRLAERGDARRLSIENVALTNVEMPTRQFSVVSVPSQQFIYDFSAKYPNVTQFGIVFKANLTTNIYEYQIWYNASQTANGTDPFGTSLISFMRSVDEAMTSVLSGTNSKFEIKLRDWPFIPPKQSSSSIVSTWGPTFFFWSSMINFITILTNIVQEKESYLRYSMEMMGLQKTVYWGSWFVTNTVIVLANSIVTSCFGLAFGFAFFTNCNFAVLVITFFLFQEAMVLFAFAITTLARKVRQAVIIGIFVFLIGLLLMSFIFTNVVTSYIFWDESVDKAVWIVLIFLPMFSFGKIFRDIAALSSGKLDPVTEALVPGEGFYWSSLYVPIDSQYIFTTGTQTSFPPPPIDSWYYFIMNIGFYALLTWYLDNVIPTEYGYRRPLWFPFTKTYWAGTTPAVVQGKVAKYDGEDDDVAEERVRACDPSGQSAMRIINLRKVYKHSVFASESDERNKVAVRDLCMNLEEGQVLVLQGKNGAGKSTSMNIMCGLSLPSSGDAIIFGKSALTEMDEIRKDMGVCPQHDILFPDLTAREHIELFAGIKNIDPLVIPDLVKERLDAVRLWKVANKAAGRYSGGMKRRLSVAICTIGDPKIVFMDEPTTGMDPLNRRAVWKFVQSFKKGRIIILTSHSMEEADVLGDRVAIMAFGKLVAIGSAIRLKQKFGAGYRLSLVTDVPRIPEAKALVSRFIPEAMLEDDSAGALLYQVPLSSVAKISPFAKELEDAFAREGDRRLVREWGISLTSLEEVFLRLIREAGREEAMLKMGKAKTD